MVRRVKVEIKKRLRQVLSLNDSPESIARSVAIGIFVAWTPTIGLQMLITFLLCCVARCNRIAGPLMAWLTNPFTIVPIFWMNYTVGALIVPSNLSQKESYSLLETAINRMSEIGISDFLLFNWDKIKEWVGGLMSLGVEVLVPLTIGSILVGAFLGLISYPLTMRAVIAFRARRAHRGDAWAAYASGTGRPPKVLPADSDAMQELDKAVQQDPKSESDPEKIKGDSKEDSAAE